MFLLKTLAVLAVVAMLLKRAILGPQKQFARLAFAFIGVGVITLLGSDRQGDASSWIAATLLLLGMLSAIVMLLANMKWTVLTGLRTWKNDK